MEPPTKNRWGCKDIWFSTHCFGFLRKNNPLPLNPKSRCGTGVARPCESQERGEKHLSFLPLLNLPSTAPLPKVRKSSLLRPPSGTGYTAPDIPGGAGSPPAPAKSDTGATGASRRLTASQPVFPPALENRTLYSSGRNGSPPDPESGTSPVPDSGSGYSPHPSGCRSRSTWDCLWHPAP